MAYTPPAPRQATLTLRFPEVAKAKIRTKKLFAKTGDNHIDVHAWVMSQNNKS
jgi:hypothetical protein